MDQTTQPTQSAPQEPVQQPAQQSKSTHPGLILYTLTVLTYYHAAKLTAQAIMSNDPTADGLFYSQADNYKFALSPVNTGAEQETADASDSDLRDMDEAVAETGDAEVVALNSNVKQKIAAEENPVEQDDETDDMDGGLGAAPSIVEP